ncbi:vomeronasal type-2 receptor 26-like [Mixophyes fleayi]|uniref:vomeronasal type-2 receptor 26-like n=1 Tax=Mixophyes fleayi TaxID=3061075 RepID=UPI003F4DA032
MTLTTLSLNVKGLNTPQKRSMLFHTLRKLNGDIIFLQETHFKAGGHPSLSSRGYPDAYYSSHSTKRNGVAILLRSSVPFVVSAVKDDPEGRFLFLSGKIGHLDITFANVYAPNTDRSASRHTSPPSSHTKHLQKQVTEAGLFDIWRALYPSSRDYTFYSFPHQTYSRIDMFMGCTNIFQHITRADIVPNTWSDHSILSLTVDLFQNPQGRTSWKLNETLLKLPGFQDLISDSITKYFELNSDPEIQISTIWEAHKAVIRGDIIQFASRRKKEHLTNPNPRYLSNESAIFMRSSKLRSLTPFERSCVYRPGDSGLISLIYHNFLVPKTDTAESFEVAWLRDTGRALDQKGWSRLRFAIEQFNNNSFILPNITLGYHVYDSCSDRNKAMKSVLQILSGPGHMVPNYSCTERGKVIAIIGDHHSVTTLPIAKLLGVYRYSHISYGATNSALGDRNFYPTFFRTLQNDRTIYSMLSKVLEYFGWKWIGVIASNDDSGEAETQLLTKYLTRRGICVAFSIKLRIYNKRWIYKRNSEIIRKSTANVIIFCGTFSHAVIKCLEEMSDVLSDRTIVLSPNWANNKFLMHNFIPDSRCSEMCLPGSRKIPRPGFHPCCYDCAPCSEGEISNTTDNENCIKCQDDEWANIKRDLCIPKSEDFLSYTNDEISAVFISVSVFFCFTTQLILGIFISHQDTPIVKANNKNLSFLLLISIMLSFLCVFLFLGHPVDITCMLRQISFGILFSIAVSSVLAKTIMVCIAFKATKPGSLWRKWMGVKLPNCVVFICSSVQVMICISWLSISPPFQELDTHSYQGQIIVQCNEGSVIGFYSVLGYMGVLAAVSFITAFIARTLPDSFNEAKYITFSMLVFCSVWIAMIPAYLSTKGKYMVAVEIFSILTSNAGLLGCIFFPKCYIILCRPELNRKLHLFDNRKS